VPDHAAVQSALLADPGRLAAAEEPVRRSAGLPPATALAAVSGPAADAFVAGVEGLDKLGPDEGRWLLRAPDHRALCDGLRAAVRPPGRLRVEVDPQRT
jgi:primosomal protein N' (replication factor Y)